MTHWFLTHTQLTPPHSTPTELLLSLVHQSLCPSPGVSGRGCRDCWNSLFCLIHSCHGTSHSTTCPWYLWQGVCTWTCWPSGYYKTTKCKGGRIRIWHIISNSFSKPSSTLTKSSGFCDTLSIHTHLLELHCLRGNTTSRPLVDSMIPTDTRYIYRVYLLLSRRYIYKVYLFLGRPCVLC